MFLFHRVLAIAVTGAAMLTGTVAHSAEIKPKPALVQVFFDASGLDDRLNAQLDFSTGITALDALLAPMKQHPDFQKMMQAISANVPQVRSELAVLYAEKLSPSELRALTAFFRTPAGKKYVSLLPEMLAAEKKLMAQGLLKIPEIQALAKVSEEQEEREKARKAALEQLELQARAGDRNAMFRLGTTNCYPPKPEERAAKLAECFDWIVKAAEGRLSAAQIYVANSYIDGRNGVQKSGADAFKWMRRAAEQGELVAMYSVGLAYAGNDQSFRGLSTGVELDASQAEKWLRKAAAAGHLSAMTDLGRMYFEGELLARSLPQSIYWYQQAAGKNNIFAMRKLGDIYERGIDSQPNAQEALKWYKLAAGVPGK